MKKKVINIPEPDWSDAPPPKPRESITALSYWFPKLVAAGLPVPRTVLVEMSQEAVKETWKLIDNPDGDRTAEAAWQGFVDSLYAASRAFGEPFFLRTDHTSAKHEWRRTCFVQDAKKI